MAFRVVFEGNGPEIHKTLVEGRGRVCLKGGSWSFSQVLSSRKGEAVFGKLQYFWLSFRERNIWGVGSEGRLVEAKKTSRQNNWKGVGYCTGSRNWLGGGLA